MLIRQSLRHLLLSGLAALAIVATAASATIICGSFTPASAQTADEFVPALEPYGHWTRHPRWGEVWVPDNRPPGWRPYTYGHWIYTDEWGWYWVSDDQEADWGWVTYHYGRWLLDRRLGWFWLPGNEWGPAWVDWRRGGDYIGWAPLPPDEVLYEYDEDPDYWIFVRPRYIGEPRLWTHVAPLQQSRIVIRDTVMVNRTIVIEHDNARRRIAVNAGIPPGVVAAVARRPVTAFRVQPRVLVGTQGVVGAVSVRPQDLRRQPGGRSRVGAPVIQRTTVIQPATSVPKPQPLGRNERGTLGNNPPRAAQGGVVAPAPSVSPSTQQPAGPSTLRPPSPGQPQQVPPPQRQGAPVSPSPQQPAPAAPAQQQHGPPAAGSPRPVPPQPPAQQHAPPAPPQQQHVPSAPPTPPAARPAPPPAARPAPPPPPHAPPPPPPARPAAPPPPPTAHPTPPPPPQQHAPPPPPPAAARPAPPHPGPATKPPPRKPGEPEPPK